MNSRALYTGPFHNSDLAFGTSRKKNIICGTQWRTHSNLLQGLMTFWKYTSMVYWKTYEFLAPMSIANSTLRCRGTPVGNHWVRVLRSRRSTPKVPTAFLQCLQSMWTILGRAAIRFRSSICFLFYAHGGKLHSLR